MILCTPPGIRSRSMGQDPLDGKHVCPITCRGDVRDHKACDFLPYHIQKMQS